MSAPAPEVTPARKASTSLRLSASEPFIFQLPAISGLRATWVPPALVSPGAASGRAPRERTATAPHRPDSGRDMTVRLARRHRRLVGAARLANGLGKPIREGADLMPVPALDHDSDHGLRSRRAQHDAAELAELRLRVVYCFADQRVVVRVHRLADLDVQ